MSGKAVIPLEARSRGLALKDNFPTIKKFLRTLSGYTVTERLMTEEEAKQFHIYFLGIKVWEITW